MSRKEHLFKILIIGDSSAGKTSFIRRYVHQLFSNHYKATIGIDFAIKTLEYDKNTIIRLHLWDIAGQDRTMGAMTRVYYKGAVGAFLVFDLNKLNKPETLNSVLNWKHDLDSKVSLSNGESLPILLIANKCDLVADEEKSCDEEDKEVENNEKILTEFVEQNNFIGFELTSAKFNLNIEEAAKVLIDEILRKQDQLDNEVGDGNQVQHGTTNYQLGSITITKSRNSNNLAAGKKQQSVQNKSCCQ